MTWIIVIIAVAVVLLLLSVLPVFNGLVHTRNAYQTAFAQIDVQLARRRDLIPNLVETAKGYLAHERETLTAVTAARAAAVAARGSAAGVPTDLAALAGAENALTKALSNMFILVEGYPELKASANMVALQEELTTTENRIAFARQAFNDAVMFYNNRRQTFPRNLIAGMLGFGPAQLFELANPQDRQTPQISF
jgi:LemA protein